MYDVKVNLIMALPGRTLMSEQECSRKVRKPYVKNGKQVYNKKTGEEVWKNVIEADPEKTHKVILKADEDDKEPITLYLRNAKPAKRVLNISEEAYKFFINPQEVPYDFHPGKDSKFKISYWKKMHPLERLEWHLKDICKALGGTLSSYAVLE